MNAKIVLFATFFFLLTTIPFSYGATSFDVGSLLLKVSLTQGKVASKSVTITSQEEGTFELTAVGIKGVSIRESSFSLQPGKTKTIEVIFDATNLEPGVYVGSIKVVSAHETSTIPVILEVDSEDVFFKGTLDVPPQYNKISPGDKLLAQFKIFDLTSGGTSDGLGTSHVDVEYLIYTVDGNVIVSDSEDIIVDRQAQLTKTFSFPKDVKKGDYILAAIIKYKNSVSVSTNTFSIEETSMAAGLDFGSSSATLFIIAGAIFAFFLVIVGLFVYFVHDRDKMLIELRNYHQEELKRMQGFLVAQERIISHKHTAGVPAAHAEIKQKLEHLRRTHIAQEKHLAHLKSNGDLNEMRRKLQEWRSQGYNTLALEYKLKGLSNEDMSSLLAYWKRTYAAKDIKTKGNSKDKR